MVLKSKKSGQSRLQFLKQTQTSLLVSDLSKSTKITSNAEAAMLSNKMHRHYCHHSQIKNILPAVYVRHSMRMISFSAALVGLHLTPVSELVGRVLILA